MHCMVREHYYMHPYVQLHVADDVTQYHFQIDLLMSSKE